MVRYVDAWWCVYILTHDLRFLLTDGESKVLAGLAEMIHKALEVPGRVCCDGRVVCKQKVSQVFLMDS